MTDRITYGDTSATIVVRCPDCERCGELTEHIRALVSSVVYDHYRDHTDDVYGGR